jgi:hypothetical protein
VWWYGKAKSNNAKVIITPNDTQPVMIEAP